MLIGKAAANYPTSSTKVSINLRDIETSPMLKQNRLLSGAYVAESENVR